MTFEQAATLPFRSWLALYLVNEVAGLTKHRSIFIHGGEDPTRQLALRFAQEAKTRVYATALSGSLSARFATNLQYRKVLDLRLGLFRVHYVPLLAGST